MPVVSNRKLRICIFNWRDPWNPKAGGAELVTLEHAKFWVAQDHDVIWVAGESGNLPAEEKKLGITFYRTGSAQTLFLRAGIIYWSKFSGNFDVVIDEIHGLPAFSPLWAWKSKKIAFIHEVAAEIWDEMFSFPVNVIGRCIETFIFPVVYRSTQFWVDSSSTKIDLMNLGIRKKKIAVIPCAIQPQPLRKVMKESELTLVFLARLVKMKGVETALKVFQKIQRKEPNAKLWIVGTGDQRYVDRLKQLVLDLSLFKNVIFWGSVDEDQKFTLLAKAHFLLHTSVKEGFGLTVLEASSQKTPALVFDVPSLRDIVVNQQTGVIAKVGDVDGLAKAARSIYEDKKVYQQMSELAYVSGQQYKWPTFTQQSLELLESTL